MAEIANQLHNYSRLRLSQFEWQDIQKALDLRSRAGDHRRFFLPALCSSLLQAQAMRDQLLKRDTPLAGMATGFEFPDIDAARRSMQEFQCRVECQPLVAQKI